MTGDTTRADEWEKVRTALLEAAALLRKEPESRFLTTLFIASAVAPEH